MTVGYASSQKGDGKMADEGTDYGPILPITVVCAGVAALGHGVLWLAYALEWTSDVPWQPVAGITLSVVAIVAFGGYYVASRRARVGIAASFLLTFLVALTFVLTIRELGDISDNAQALFDDFRNVVMLIVGFYFGSEAALGVAKVLGASRGAGDMAEIQQADRDLVSPAPQAGS